MNDAAPGDGENTAIPDPRPRPQYGEYASADEQRARIRQPYATDALIAGQALDEPANTVAAKGAPTAVAPASTSAYGQPAAAGHSSSAPRPLRGWRLADRIVTIGLLAYGLVNVIATSFQLFAFEQYANTTLSLFGVEESFSNISEGRLWGSIAAITLIVGWILTALLSWLRLRRGRVSFWIPLVGALVVGIAVSVLISVPLFGDPAFTQLVDRFTA